MIKIAHRGNMYGPNPDEENRPEYIEKALDNDYYVEADVWRIGKEWFLGHDKPLYPLGQELRNWSYVWAYVKIIYHAKNMEALMGLSATTLHYFWHENDLCTITSHGWIWKYP